MKFEIFFKPDTFFYCFQFPSIFIALALTSCNLKELCGPGTELLKICPGRFFVHKFSDLFKLFVSAISVLKKKLDTV